MVLTNAPSATALQTKHHGHMNLLLVVLHVVPDKAVVVKLFSTNLQHKHVVTDDKLTVALVYAVLDERLDGSHGGVVFDVLQREQLAPAVLTLKALNAKP